MYLKMLELQGFKSFPDKTILTFKKGISAVVGPNGSGKSNIADAMRWVMGEQSSKALRGEKMAGVIFHGCGSRRESPFAQVTLTIDNEDRALNLDSDEVAVSRKLYKNGDSEYLLNGRNVLLKDINELLMDTGLGKDGYSIIGQGRIADIVNGKAADRREIFEEAAGISLFRYKKREAETKLVQAEDNIARITDILTELEGRLEPLRKQCEKAKRFRVLDEEKRRLEVSVWNRRLEEQLKKLEDYKERLELIRQQHAQLSEELSETERAIDQGFMEAAKRSALADELRQKIHDAQLAQQSDTAEIAVCENDISHMEESITRLREEIERAAADKYFLRSELEKRGEELKKLLAGQDGNAQEVSAKEKEFDEFLTKAEETDREVSDSNSAVSGLYLEKSRLSFTLESLKNTLSETQEQLMDNASGAEETMKLRKLAESEVKRLAGELTAAREKAQENQNRLGGLTKLREGREQKLKKATEELDELRAGLQEQSGRLKILKDLESSMEGFGYSTKFIMTAVKQGRIHGVCGTVAQLISVEPEHTVAIETALGAALQNIVTESEETAKRGIKLLKENRAGRATFLPLTSVKGTRNDDTRLSDEEGYVAMACDLVKYDKKYEGIVMSLLGRICVCEDIDCAAVIAKKHGYRFRIVTLDGQVINAGGSFTGGSAAKSAGILSRKNEIEKLEKSIASLTGKQSEAVAVRDRLAAETANLDAQLEAAREEKNELAQTCTRLEMEHKRAGEYAEEYEKAAQDAAGREEQLKEKLIAAQKELDETAQGLKDLDRQILEGEAALSLTVTRREELKAQREALSQELSELRIAGAELSKDIAACRSAMEQLGSSIESSDSDAGKNELEISGLEGKIADKRAQIEGLKLKIEDAKKLERELEVQMESAQREHLELDAAANKLRSSQKNKLNEKEELASQISRGEERINGISADFDSLVTRLWDEYELTRTTAAELAEPIEDMAGAEKELTSLKNKIRALGSVNLEAISEYEEVSGRYETMSTQLGDVNKSKEELCGLIDDLTAKMKSVFSESFERIDRNFREIFRELFGGGKGELILTDPEDVLGCGIEINVQPPGKVITTLMSLSGGEQALVAIAIYFAILKNKPSPFCLLDEIEAALDDVNVTRYARFLHRLTDKTQFITITHRRGTMEEADVLYGVTMQEGVSRLLRMTVEETRQLSLEDQN